MRRGGGRGGGGRRGKSVSVVLSVGFIVNGFQKGRCEMSFALYLHSTRHDVYTTIRALYGNLHDLGR